MAKLLANELLSAYLKGELEALEYVKTASDDSLPSVRLTWQDSKTDLTELIYLSAFSQLDENQWVTFLPIKHLTLSRSITLLYPKFFVSLLF